MIGLVGLTLRKLLFILFALVALVLGGLVLLSQRPGQVGLVNGALAVCMDPKVGLNSQLGPRETRIEPLYVGERVNEAWQQLQRILVDDSRGHLRAAEGPWIAADWQAGLFRIKNDLEFLQIQTAGVIHIRSASRLGRFGFGMHEKAVNSLRLALSKAMADLSRPGSNAPSNAPSEPQPKVQPSRSNAE